jgi:hypothetical protein
VDLRSSKCPAPGPIGARLLEAPGSHAAGVDSDDYGGTRKSLRRSPYFDPARAPRLEHLIDDDRSSTVAGYVTVFLGRREIVASHIYGVGFRVVAPSNGNDVWRAVEPDCCDPSQAAPATQEIQLCCREHAHLDTGRGARVATAGRTATATAHTTMCMPAIVRRIGSGGPGIVAGIESDVSASRVAKTRKFLIGL